MRLSAIVVSVIACIAASGHAFQVTRLVGAPMTAMTSSSSALQVSSNEAPPLKRNPPRRVCLMVEPTPFTHVSGYSNRFKEMLKFMKKAGDEVDILTVDSQTPAKDLPKEFCGHRILHTQGFTFPLYNQISLSLDLPEMKGAQIMEKFKPDLIHVTSP
jgi:sulfoquinovosyltransferase